MRQIILVLTFVGLTGCAGLFFYPYEQHVLTPDQLDLDYEDVYLKSSDGLRLHGWYLPARGRPVGTILFLHGNAENISTHIGSVYWLPDRQFNVFLLDYRGYGASEGKPGFAGALADVEDVIAYLVARKGADSERLVLFGQSLGGALAIYSAAHTAYRPHIKALVVESALSSYRGITREKLAGFWLTWPLQWPLSRLVSDDYSPLQAIAAVSPVPLLIIHGDQDRIVPVHHAQRLYEAAQEPKQLWIVEGAGHIQAFASPEYRERFVTYLRQALSPL